MISHAIFCLFPSHRHPAPHRLPLRLPLHPRLPPRASLHIPPCISPFTSLHIPPCTPPSIPPELHLAPCTPLFTLLCAALLPPRIPSRPSPSTPPPPIPILIPQPVSSSSHRQAPPSTSLHFPPAHPFPSHFFAPQDSFSQVPPSLHVTPSSSRPPISHPRFSTLRVPQPSPACGFSRA